MKPYKVLVCGSRSWGNFHPINVVLSGLRDQHPQSSLVVIHGAAPGADSLADLWARLNKAIIDPYPAKWDVHDFVGLSGVPCYSCSPDDERCPAAGPRRNQEMLEVALPDVVYAFTDDLAASKGTADMVSRAVAAGVPTYVIGRAR